MSVSGRGGEPPRARRFVVRGRVQGVGFRYFVRERALALGLAGHARNLPDGRVEVEAQGPAEALDMLAAELARGPALARVEGVEAGEIEPHPGRESFGIAR